jgi:chloride channel 7
MLKKKYSVVTFLFEKSCDQLSKSSIMMQKQWTEEAINQGLHLPLVFFIYASFGISLVLFSSCLVLFWAPAAAGGGVNYVFHF